MPRQRDGHADLDDIYDRLESNRNDDSLLREVKKTNLLLEALLRAQNILVPVAKYIVICTNCNNAYIFIQHEGQNKVQPMCTKCHFQQSTFNMTEF